MHDFRLSDAVAGEMTPGYAHKALLLAKLALWEIRRDETGEIIILASKDYKDLLGWAEDEFPRRVSDYLAQCVHPEDRRRISDIVERYADSGFLEMKDVELRLCHRQTGEWRWYRALSDLGDVNPGGTVFGCIIDVHEARTAQDELRASEINLKATAQALAKSQTYLKEVVESTNVAIWDWNRTTDAVTVNDNYARMLGYELGEIVPTMSWLLQLIHPDDMNSVRNLNAALVASPEVSIQFNFRLRHKQGNYIWVFGRARCLEYVASGTLARIVGMQVDFTQWKELEGKQAESLQIISRQKEILEKQLSEQMKLINGVQGQVETLINSPGNRLDAVQKNLRQEMRTVRKGIEKNGMDADNAFSRYMELAFKFIANEMVWYKAVLDSLPFPTSVYDLTRRWYYLNQPAAEAMGGEKVEAFVGRHYSQGWKNYEDADTVFANDSTGKKTFTRRLANGNRVYQCQTSFLLGENNRPLGLIETMQDITAASDAEERIKLMLDATPVACCFFDRDDTLLDCNLMAASICGLSDKAEYIEHFYEYMPPVLADGRAAPQVLKDAINEAFAKGASELEHFLLRNREGVDIPGEIRLKRVEWRGKHIVLGYFRDTGKLVASRKQLEQEKLLLREILDCCPVDFSISRDNIVEYVSAHTRQQLDLNVGDHCSKMFNPEELAGIQGEMKARGGKGLSWYPVTVKQRDGSRSRYMLSMMDVEYQGAPASMMWFVDTNSLEKRLAEMGRAAGGVNASGSGTGV